MREEKGKGRGTEKRGLEREGRGGEEGRGKR